MDPLHRLTRGATGAIRLGRGLADRAIRITGPPVTRVVGRVAEGRLVRRRTTTESSPTTFVPSKPKPKAAAKTPRPARVTPGSVAGNIAKQRPTARAQPAGAVRKSVPGAKLPPRRPNATA